MAHSMASDLGLHCLHRPGCPNYLVLSEYVFHDKITEDKIRN